MQTSSAQTSPQTETFDYRKHRRTLGLFVVSVLQTKQSYRCDRVVMTHTPAHRRTGALTSKCAQVLQNTTFTFVFPAQPPDL